MMFKKKMNTTLEHWIEPTYICFSFINYYMNIFIFILLTSSPGSFPPPSTIVYEGTCPEQPYTSYDDGWQA